MPRFPLSRLVHGAQIVLTALILAAGVIVPAGLPQRAIASESGAAAPSARSVRMFAETGYFVERDAFWDFFGHRGGVRTFGYPVSQDFSFLGCSTQMFQRLVVQQCAGGGVATLNLLDGDLVPYTRINGSTFPSIDATVVERAPAPGASDYVSAVQDFLQAVVPDTFEGEPVGFHRTFETTVSLEDAFPAGDGDPKLLTLLNLELWGLPTSQPVRDPNNGGFVYQRFQRGIMHYDSACACTQGLLLADYLKALITGSGLPADLEEQAGTSPLLRSAISGRLPQGTSYLGAFHEIETLTAGLVGGAAPRGSAFVATTNAIQMAPSITSAPSAPSSSAPLAPLAPQAAPAATATPVSTTVPTRVPTATPSPQPTQAPQLRPSGQFIYGAVVGNPTSTASQAKSAGLTHISAFVPWKNVEPRKGHFLFKQMESWGEPVANDLTNVLNAAKANGLKLVFRLDSPPDWAGGALYKLNPGDVENYVYEVVRYGRGTIAFVEVFNEPNLPFEWGTSPVDPAAYTRLLAAAYRGAKRADASVQVVSAALSPRTGGYGGTMEDVDFLDGVYRAVGQAHFNMLGLHAYLGNFAPEADSSCVPMCFRTIELLRAVMEKHGDSAKKALITEIGVLEQTAQDLGAYEWMELPADKRADYLVKALQLANANYRWIAGAMVFNLDYATTPWVPQSSPMHWFSLLNPDRSPRQAYNRLKDARTNGALP